MLLPLLLASLSALSLASLAQADRNLPADLQVDLLFPRNETYAPTQLFPIVIGIQNLDALWPLDIFLDLDVRSLDAWQEDGLAQPATWQFVNFQLSSKRLAEAVGPNPGKQFLYYPTVNMTNGTTESFVINWGITMFNRCFDNESVDDGGEGWSSGIDGGPTRHEFFSTAPGGKVPDVAATLDACPEGGENTTATVRVTEVRETRRTGDQCPVLDTDVRPVRCAYRDVAEELAANVSAAILKRLGCEEGTWQNMTAPCVRRKNGAASSTGLRSFVASWTLVLGMTLAVYYHVF